MSLRSTECRPQKGNIRLEDEITPIDCDRAIVNERKKCTVCSQASVNETWKGESKPYFFHTCARLTARIWEGSETRNDIENLIFDKRSLK